jgi:hypothetical protein
MVRMNYRSLPPGSSEADHAQAVNKCLLRMTSAHGNMIQYRAWAGFALLDAQKDIPPGRWQAWCSAHVDRSQGDIRKLMAIAKDENPEAAHEAAKASNAVANAELRARSRERVSEPEPTTRPQLRLVSDTVDPVETWMAAWRALSPADKARARQALAADDAKLRAASAKVPA